jgi:hypothetical protein
MEHGFPTRTKPSRLTTFLCYYIYQGHYNDKDLINLVNKLQDTFSNLVVYYKRARGCMEY